MARKRKRARMKARTSKYVSVRGHTRTCPGGGRCRVGGHRRRLKYGSRRAR